MSSLQRTIRYGVVSQLPIYAPSYGAVFEPSELSFYGEGETYGGGFDAQGYAQIVGATSSLVSGIHGAATQGKVQAHEEKMLRGQNRLAATQAQQAALSTGSVVDYIPYLVFGGVTVCLIGAGLFVFVKSSEKKKKSQKDHEDE